ncbi:hypothetical protein [Spirosoma aerophilum]
MPLIEKTIVNGVATYATESVPNSGRFDTPLASLPNGAVPAFVSRKLGLTYKPSAAKRTINLAQTGVKVSESNYRRSADWRPANVSHAEWRTRGIGMISKWCSDNTDGSNKFSDLPEALKFDYATESAILAGTGGGPRMAGHYFYTATLAEMEIVFMRNIPAYGPGAHWTANLEETNLWRKEYYGGQANPQPNYPSWDSVKNMSIVCECDGITRTLEQLFADAGKFADEEGTRRANRFALFVQVAKRAGAFGSIGASMYQGEPFSDALTTSARFLDTRDVNVSNIGGVNGTITLNGRQYTNMTGSFWKQETCHLDYHYYFTVDFTGSNYDSISSFPDLWPYLSNVHPLAREIGHWLANRKRMMDVHGSYIPSIRMTEFFYEGDRRVPTALGAHGAGGELIKPFLPPYVMEIMTVSHHFLEGETPGAGMHIFAANASDNNPSQGIIYTLDTDPRYDFHMHTVETYFTAGRMFENHLDFLANSILTTDLSVQVGGSGAFQTYNAVDAYSFRQDGGRGPYKPTGATRHRAVSGGTQVVIIWAMYQTDNDTRTDVIKIPGLAGDNAISLTYKGRTIQVFETFIPTGTTNTTFTASSIVPAWEKPGYGSLIDNS